MSHGIDDIEAAIEPEYPIDFLKDILGIRFAWYVVDHKRVLDTAQVEACQERWSDLMCNVGKSDQRVRVHILEHPVLSMRYRAVVDKDTSTELLVVGVWTVVAGRDTSFFKCSHDIVMNGVQAHAHGGVYGTEPKFAARRLKRVYVAEQHPRSRETEPARDGAYWRIGNRLRKLRRAKFAEPSLYKRAQEIRKLKRWSMRSVDEDAGTSSVWRELS